MASQSQVSIEALLNAVASLHEAPQDTSVWIAAMHSLSSAIPCEQGVLAERLGRTLNEGFGLLVGIDAQFVGEYQREYHRIDPFAEEDVVARLQQLGRATFSHEILDDFSLQNSAFRTQFLNRYGDLFHGLGGSFPVADGAWAQIWLFRTRGQPFDESEHRLMDVFFAHARAALRQRRWLTRIERERDAALAWIDCSGDAIFVLDGQAGLVFANLIGERLLYQGDCVLLRGGRLRPAKNTDPDWIGNSLRALLDESRTHDRDAAYCLAVPGRSKSQPRLHAVFSTLRAAPTRLPASATQVGLVLRDLQQSMPHFTSAQLRELFGFTAAEARIANALLTGQTVESIAAVSQVRPDTVRAHIKRMLAKTGTQRQSDLQKLLAKALPNLRSLQTNAEMQPAPRGKKKEIR